MCQPTLCHLHHSSRNWPTNNYIIITIIIIIIIIITIIYRENFSGRLQQLVINGERILDEAHLKQLDYEGGHPDDHDVGVHGDGDGDGDDAAAADNDDGDSHDDDRDDDDDDDNGDDDDDGGMLGIGPGSIIWIV